MFWRDFDENLKKSLSKYGHFPGSSSAGAATGDRNLRKMFGVSGSPKSKKSKKKKRMDGFGFHGMEIGFDRLCRGVKLDFLQLGTTKTLQNPKKSKKNIEKPGFWG